MLDVTGRGIIGAMNMTLAKFVDARLDEFEAGIDTRGHDSGQCDWLQGIHLDTAEARRWVAAGRAIIAAYVVAAGRDRGVLGPLDHFADGLEVAVRALAAIWPFHADYESTWA